MQGSAGDAGWMGVVRAGRRVTLADGIVELDNGSLGWMFDPPRRSLAPNPAAFHAGVRASRENRPKRAFSGPISARKQAKSP